MRPATATPKARTVRVTVTLIVLDVSFQQVVHLGQTEEAGVARPQTSKEAQMNSHKNARLTALGRAENKGLGSRLAFDAGLFAHGEMLLKAAAVQSAVGLGPSLDKHLSMSDPHPSKVSP